VCLESMCKILRDFLQPSDRFAFYWFNTRVQQLRALSSRGDSTACAAECERITNENRCGGGTAFFDAILQGLHEASSSEEAARRDQWVIALTDGGDNSSRSSSVGEACSLLRTHKGLHLIIITVGKEYSKDKNEMVLKAARDNGSHGVHVSADDTGQLHDAFKRVEQLIEQANIEYL